MIRVRLFASLRELAGAPSLDVPDDELSAVSSVGDLIEALGRRYGDRFIEIARAGSVVIDGERAPAERVLAGSEEVALLPPVSGGTR